jgi:hypothetical protein
VLVRRRSVYANAPQLEVGIETEAENGRIGRAISLSQERATGRRPGGSEVTREGFRLVEQT